MGSSGNGTIIILAARCPDHRRAGALYPSRSRGEYQAGLIVTGEQTQNIRPRELSRWKAPKCWAAKEKQFFRGHFSARSVVF